jgi:hypothetical protein
VTLKIQNSQPCTWGALRATRLQNKKSDSGNIFLVFYFSSAEATRSKISVKCSQRWCLRELQPSQYLLLKGIVVVNVCTRTNTDPAFLYTQRGPFGALPFEISPSMEIQRSSANIPHFLPSPPIFPEFPGLFQLYPRAIKASDQTRPSSSLPWRL